MKRMVCATFAVLAFSSASAVVAAPPREGPLPGSTDEAALRRIVASATPPPIAAVRAKLNAALTARLRAIAPTSVLPTGAVRPVLPSRPLATCAPPAISNVRGEANGDGTVTPDDTLGITGCGLGTAPGSATLVVPGLRAPLQLTLVPVCATPDFMQEISCWQDSAAVFRVPHVQNLGDSPATLAVTPAGGKTLQVPVRFVALRQNAVVYGVPPIYGKCSHATNNDGCITTLSGPLNVTFEPNSNNYSVLALHQSLCCFNGVRDHDDYQATLMAQWTVTSVEIAVDAQLPYCSVGFSNANGPVSSATLEAPVFSADKRTANFRVDYSVGPACSEIVYAVAIVARGPLGTFYVVKPPSGHR